MNIRSIAIQRRVSDDLVEVNRGDETHRGKVKPAILQISSEEEDPQRGWQYWRFGGIVIRQCRPGLELWRDLREHHRGHSDLNLRFSVSEKRRPLG